MWFVVLQRRGDTQFEGGISTYVYAYVLGYPSWHVTFSSERYSISCQSMVRVRLQKMGLVAMRVFSDMPGTSYTSQ